MSAEITLRLKLVAPSEDDPFGDTTESLPATPVEGRPRRFELKDFSFYLPLASGDVVVADPDGFITALDTPAPGWLIRVLCKDEEIAEAAYAQWSRAVPAYYNRSRMVTLLTTSKEWVDSEVAAHPDRVDGIEVLRRPGETFSVEQALERWWEL